MIFFLRLVLFFQAPSKPVHIAQPRKEKDVNKAPDFVYNVMGSSAGAGSGEFHVYRQLRRKEYERQRVLESRKSKEDLDDAFQIKREEAAKAAEDKTAKKRAKRQKKKQNAKRNKLNRDKNPPAKQSAAADKSDSDTEDEEEKSDEKKDEPVKEEEKSSKQSEEVGPSNE